ncbi:MAG: hypothetical protein GF334_03240 [Candidatus Altiarchaeales archaeon]|nr:hypothetical protein [Candidatus Altiarchaeales archaeon]
MLDDYCMKCEVQTHTPEPAKYSPQDPWGAYRRKMKAQENGCS